MNIDNLTAPQALMLRAERSANLYYTTVAVVAVGALAVLPSGLLAAPGAVTYGLGGLLVGAYVTNRIARHRCDDALARALELLDDTADTAEADRPGR
ncbi:hypothetical protein [Catellatospora sp. NPDC049609]|uniref:hypothetical protein n=1 Tax=Catellatospora sp. NPDC049609 TaxID=3155505 RepID=UPI0034378A1C